MLDQSFFLQQQPHRAAPHQLVQAFDHFGVDADRKVDGVGRRYDLVVLVLDLLIEERLVLVAVCIQIALGPRDIRPVVVGEFDGPDFQAVFFSNLFDLLKNLRRRAGGHAGLDGLVLRQHGNDSPWISSIWPCTVRQLNAKAESHPTAKASLTHRWQMPGVASDLLRHRVRPSAC